MKKIMLMFFLLSLSLCACGNPIAPEDIGEFSYSEVREYYTEDMWGVITEGFVNTGGTKPIDAEEAVKLAKQEKLWPYDSIALAYDSEAEVWEVHFWTSGAAGGGISVYLDSYGRTLMMVGGE